jgi:predicted dehydrogenase
MVPRYRAAIIGTGRIASLLERDPLRAKPHSHAGWYRHHPDIELMGGADIDQERLATFGMDWGIPDSHLFTDYREMLHCLRPNIVSICAYASQRLEMVQASIEAGASGLWIEKAVVCSLAEAGVLERLLRESGVKAIVDHPRRTDPAYRAVKRIIDERTLGELLGVTCMMSGNLIHTGSHAYDMLQFWCGEMTGAIGWLEQETPLEGPIEDCGGSGHMIFDSGAHAFIVGSSRDYYIFQFDLAFTQGRIQIGNDIRRVLRPAPSRLYSGFEELFEVPGFELNDPYRYPMVYDLVHALETNQEPLMSVGNAINAFKMGLALFQSDREGHRLLTPRELDPSLRIESI